MISPVRVLEQRIWLRLASWPHGATGLLSTQRRSRRPPPSSAPGTSSSLRLLQLAALVRQLALVEKCQASLSIAAAMHQSAANPLTGRRTCYPGHDRHVQQHHNERCLIAPFLPVPVRRLHPPGPRCPSGRIYKPGKAKPITTVFACPGSRSSPAISPVSHAPFEGTGSNRRIWTPNSVDTP